MLLERAILTWAIHPDRVEIAVTDLDLMDSVSLEQIVSALSGWDVMVVDPPTRPYTRAELRWFRPYVEESSLTVGVPVYSMPLVIDRTGHRQRPETFDAFVRQLVQLQQPATLAAVEDAARGALFESLPPDANARAYL